jgi:hypothetical protein
MDSHEIKKIEYIDVLRMITEIEKLGGKAEVI